MANRTEPPRGTGADRTAGAPAERPGAHPAPTHRDR